MMKLENNHWQHHNSQWMLKIIGENLVIFIYLTVFPQNLPTNHKGKKIQALQWEK